MIKKSIIVMTASALLSSVIANAQIYNESASSRQSASSDLGMYQLTLAAFRASSFYNGDSQASQYIREQVNKTKFGGEACITVNNSGFPTPVRSPQSMKPYKTYSYWVGQELVNAAYAQRDVYISLSTIAVNSFPAIKKSNMSRSQAIKFIAQQIDKDLFELLKKNDYTGTANISTNVSGGGRGFCQGDYYGYANRAEINKKFDIEYAKDTDVSGLKSSNDFVRDYSSNFEDGFVLKSNSGSPDLSYRGQPWFSESGIQGQKLSIGSSSEKGSNTTQKRGE